MGNVLLERDGGVAVLTLDSPEVKNGLTPEMSDELVAYCDEIDADKSYGCAVVVGADGSFCSGADRRRWVAGADQSEDVQFKSMGRVYQSFMRVGQLKVPVVAGVRGSVVGAGMNLMLAADLRVVSHDARILAGFLKIGVHPGGGFFTLTGRLAGREATAAMGLFNEEIDGRKAVELGMAWESVDDDQVEGRARELAARACRDPELTRATVLSMRTELGPPGIPWDVALQYERPTQMWSLRRR
ncbi:enoyl-CoA hydratase/isomerase family protein [Rhodococcus fascians]|nr:enoyl-CoA hydratase/isomerase family protein [Rhodococcus fascians]MBY3999962.1 enoyl-CoA hydratase/isomerase family protein [Rhodococcus fascians]MBY4005145.1 enoyl-CoA hydratase/isomerase family protein [Rhodococcus fascians]MBY4010296.1 enoyl-CoA hydratase/isomerase family protein [Rhodococcus fascians]MBY4020339.1 enoyl-CoA hydratase/isomerase family protein [Rhodococcus fascians]